MLNGGPASGLKEGFLPDVLNHMHSPGTTSSRSIRPPSTAPPGCSWTWCSSWMRPSTGRRPRRKRNHDGSARGPEIPDRQGRDGARADGRVPPRADRAHRERARPAARGGRRPGRRAARHPLPPRRVDRAAGRPPRPGQPPQRLPALQVGVDRGRAHDQDLRRGALGRAPRLAHRAGRGLARPARQPAPPLGGAAARDVRRRLPEGPAASGPRPHHPRPDPRPLRLARGSPHGARRRSAGADGMGIDCVREGKEAPAGNPAGAQNGSTA